MHVAIAVGTTFCLDNQTLNFVQLPRKAHTYTHPYCFTVGFSGGQKYAGKSARTIAAHENWIHI
jgi:hypothetical protein